jgi:bifunctional DNA-binding transcriptional regulator/antitoxin component of YhaV-PrlF toxin-antitoxin module
LFSANYQGKAMARLTKKRQVILPKNVWNATGFQAGDFVDVFARDGVINVVKMDSENLAVKSNDPIKYKDLPTIDDFKNSQ